MSTPWFAVNEKKLVKRLGDIRAGYGRVGVQVSRSVAEQVATEARNRVHVRTGYTKSTIMVKPGVNQYTTQVTASGPGALAEEYGTRYRPAHPFLAPAAAAIEPRALAEFKQALVEVHHAGAG